MKAGTAVLVLAGMLACGSAAADGNQLLNACQSVTQAEDSNGQQFDSYKVGYCLGVINGVTSLTGITNPAFPKTNQTCLPKPSVTGGQAARILVKFMTEFPERLNLDDGFIAMLALQRAFPCK